MKYFLGLVCLGHHDAAAAIVNEQGVLLAAAEEERYSRIKFDPSFPLDSINFCLKQANIKITDVESIGYFFDSSSFFWQRVLFALKNPKYIKSYARKYLKLKKYNNIGYEINKNFPEYKGKINLHHHHLCHAASVFYTSPFERSTIISIDGVGEWETAWYGVGDRNNIKKIKSISWPNSLGVFYASMTQFLGYKENSDEYKVMGMAPYGEDKYSEQLSNMIRTNDAFDIKINKKYFDFPFGKNPYYNSEKFTKLFGNSNGYKSEPSQRDKDLAFSFQKKLTECFIGLVEQAVKSTGIKDVCVTGGVAMNCAAIGELIKNKNVEKVFLNFASADDGCAIGAAFLEAKNYSQNFSRQKSYSPFLGNDWNDDKIKDILDKYSLKYSFLNKDIVEKTAKELLDGRVIGWFQGRTEFGQRALGNRSILANPCKKNMKDIINKKIKNREKYRPFAPSILYEEAHKFFHLHGNTSPFMTHTFKVKEKIKNKIPSVVHVDNTSRVQMVSKTDGIFYKLIKSFYGYSKVPLILNTSFNVNGEPIVNSPEEAVKCFLNTDIDCLSIGPYFIKKK